MTTTCAAGARPCTAPIDEAAGILAGDALLTYAFDVLADDATHADPGVRAALVLGLARAAGVGGMAGGQMLDLEAEGRYGDGGMPLDLNEQEISRLQAMKTGALLAFAAEAGAIIAEAPAMQRAALLAYGKALGAAFQVADDILDIEASAESVGKATGKDAGARQGDARRRSRARRGESRARPARPRGGHGACRLRPGGGHAARRGPLHRGAERVSRGIAARAARLLRAGAKSSGPSIAVACGLLCLDTRHPSPSVPRASGVGYRNLLLSGRHRDHRSTAPRSRTSAVTLSIYDEGRLGILVLVLVAVTASFAAIVVELASARVSGKTDALALILAGATVVLSWTFTHVMFALHYAHEFYGQHEAGERRGLEFPGNPDPDYLDFLYFAFVIGCATATADVNITSRRIRKIALVHGVLSFAFNTAILALSINIAAGLIPA